MKIASIKNSLGGFQAITFDFLSSCGFRMRRARFADVKIVEESVYSIDSLLDLPEVKETIIKG